MEASGNSPAFAARYLAHYPEALETAKRLRGRLSWEIGSVVGMLVTPFLGLVVVAAMSESLDWFTGLIVGLIEGGCYIALFLWLRPDRRGRGATLRWAGFALAALALPQLTSMALRNLQARDLNRSASEFGMPPIDPIPSLAETDPMGAMIGTFIALAIFGLAISRVLAQQRGIFDRRRQTDTLIALDPAKIPALAGMLDQLVDRAAAFGLPAKLPAIWLDRTSSALTPSVTADPDDAEHSHLLVPRGYFGLAGADPALAAAVLGHEFAHTQQQDAYLCGDAYLSGSLLLRTLATLMIIVTIERVAILATYTSVLQSSTKYTLLFPAVANGRLFLAHGKLLEARKRSELLADCYAASVADPAALARAIDACASDGSYVHPDRKVRHAQLDWVANASAEIR